jgi:hypothetical protein
MLLKAIIGASFKTIEYFYIGTLHLSIAFWMSNRGVENLDVKIFIVPFKGTTSKLGLIIDDDPIWDAKSAYDGLDEFHYGLLIDFDHWVASGHLVNLSMATYRNGHPPTAWGNSPTMSAPHIAKGHEGREYLQCLRWHVDLHGVELACLAGLHQLDGVLKGRRPVKSMLKGFTDQCVGRCMVPALTSMDLCEQLTTLLLGNAIGSCATGSEPKITLSPDSDQLSGVRQGRP